MMEIRKFGSILVVLASLLGTGLCIDSFSYPGDSTKNQYNYTSKTYNHSLNAAWKFGDTQQFIWSTSQVGGVRLRLWQWNMTDNSEVLCGEFRKMLAQMGICSLWNSKLLWNVHLGRPTY